MEAEQKGEAVLAPVPTPLTERVLERLGRPRIGWILAWSVVALLSPLVFGGAIELSGRPFEGRVFMELLTTQGVLAYVVFVLLIGTGFLARGRGDPCRLLGCRHDRGRRPPDQGRLAKRRAWDRIDRFDRHRHTDNASSRQCLLDGTSSTGGRGRVHLNQQNA